MTPNEQFIYNYFASKGMTQAGIAGLMGNLQHESGLMPNNLNNDWNGKYGMSDEVFTQNVNTGAFNLSDKSGAYGIAQWLGGRKTGLENFAKQSGRQIDDLNMQCDYLWYELNTSYTGVRDVLMTTNDTKKAAQVVQDRFEVCGDGTSSRQANAANYAAQMGMGIQPVVMTAQEQPNLTVEATSMPKMNIDGKEFDPEYYYSSNPDVAAICGKNADALAAHYISTGRAEGRAANVQDAAQIAQAPIQPQETSLLTANNGKVFDPTFYAANNPDVVAAFGTSPEAMLNHYNKWGAKEGRMASAQDMPAQSVQQPTQSTGLIASVGNMCMQQGDLDFELNDGSIFSVENTDGSPEYFLNGESMGKDANAVENKLSAAGLVGQIKGGIDDLIAQNSQPLPAEQAVQDPMQALLQMLQNQQTV